ncbi:MAG: DNA cytosine methyltransferase [bacterium]
MNRPRVIELFCGLGGFAEATGGQADVVLAADASAHVLEIYRANFDHPARQMNLEAAHSDAMAKLDADIWWMSPPCQPHTVRGHQLDLDDPRSASFEKTLQMIADVRPPRIGMENVEGFKGSDAYDRLHRTLERSGYLVHEQILCPTDFGVPNRRPRYYMAASRETTPTFELRQVGRPFPEYLDATHDPKLEVTDAQFEKYGHAFVIVDHDDPEAITSCFTSAYGKSWVYSGSYLRHNGVLRRFSPAEVLRLMHFRPGFLIPPTVSTRKAWKFIGNSLSVPPTRATFEALWPAACGDQTDI